MALKHTPIPLAIVGGGAAGLFAASVAAGRALPSLVFERKARLGTKLLMTANGRCNFTRDLSPEAMAQDLGDPVGPWVLPALEACPPSLIAGGFRALGVKLRRMDDGRLFPASGEARTIVHAFGDFLRDEGVPLCTNCPVTGIQPMKNGFLVAAGFFTVWAEKVLVATGGLSFPKTGSVGDGFRMARETGHTVEPCRAGLIGYETADPQAVRRAGERIADSCARVLDKNGAPLFEASGEVACETWGVGGAAVYNCSRYVARHPPAGGWTLEVRFGDGPVLRLASPAPRPIQEAIVTIGGVSLSDVNPATMESRKLPGLYFAGEVLDIDGPTGGYNITLAFATARLAVESVCDARGMPPSRPAPRASGRPRGGKTQKPRPRRPRRDSRGRGNHPDPGEIP
ncbi:MAG: NAD(P)/FAD-dependent oxidoreductase [Kiritimatiellia bacterium]|jgi:predicted flavoprotein YhiN